jgi:hypothetical protein
VSDNELFDSWKDVYGGDEWLLNGLEKRDSLEGEISNEMTS